MNFLPSRILQYTVYDELFRSLWVRQESDGVMLSVYVFITTAAHCFDNTMNDTESFFYLFSFPAYLQKYQCVMTFEGSLGIRCVPC